MYNTIEKKLLGVIDGKNVFLCKHHKNEITEYFHFGVITGSNGYASIKELSEDRDYTLISAIFNSTPHSFDTWWRLVELFNTAYTLKATVTIYDPDNVPLIDHICHLESDYELFEKLNGDLESVLDTIWRLIP